MAYTPAPETSTYSSHRVPLAQPISLRANIDPTIETPLPDGGLINLLPLKFPGQEELMAVTRPVISGNDIGSTPATGEVRGMFMWEKSTNVKYFYIVIAQRIWTTAGDPTVAANWANVANLATFTGVVRFTEFISSTGTETLVLVDGTNGYTFTTNAAPTIISDAQFPSPHLPFPVFMDGYLFLAKANGDIYNSVLDNPASWVAGDFISAEMYPDALTALVKVNNFVLAIGTETCEYFYNAANATASPLARNDGAALPFGTQFPNSIACNKDTVIFLANVGDGQPQFKLVQEFKHKDLDSTWIVSIYNTRLNSSTNPLTYDECRGYFFRHNGELYYSFLMSASETIADRQVSNNNCFCFGLNTGLWSELQYGNNTDRSARFVFPVQHTGLNNTGKATTYIAGNLVYNTGPFSGSKPFFGQLIDGGTPSNRIAGDYYTTSTTLPVYQEMRLPNLDFGTMNLKFMSRLGLDVELLGSSVADTIKFYVLWNDSDFNESAWVGPRELSLYTGTSYFPYITQLGSFRRRGIVVYNVDGNMFRTKFVELDINKGQQ